MLAFCEGYVEIRTQLAVIGFIVVTGYGEVNETGSPRDRERISPLDRESERPGERKNLRDELLTWLESKP